jgi:XTP/dITP diphosphohydrolase
MIAVKDRFAYYQATVCYYQNAQTPPLYTIGKLEGTIALNSSGTEGFGYDPIFIPSGQSQTMAQLGIDFKNSHSARYKAWKQISSRLAIIENFD